MNINVFTASFLLLYLFPKETLQILPETKYQENGCYGSLPLEYGFMQGACSVEQVIAVESVNAGTKLQTSGCDREGISNGFNDTTFSTCCYPASGDCVFTYTSTSNPYVYQRACSGRTTCTTLPVANMLTPTSQCDTSSTYWFTSTYLYMDFYCIEESRIGDASSTTLVNGGNGSALYIWNPGYPDAELNAFAYYTCSMETDCNSNINITAIDIRFDTQSGTCYNTVTFDEKYSSKSVDCNISNGFEIQNIYTSESNYVVMNVSNEFGSLNGLFWLAIQSTSVSGSLVINCPATEPLQNCSDYQTTSDYTTTVTTSESHTSIPMTENDSSTSNFVTSTSTGDTTTSESHTSLYTTENHSSTSNIVTTTSSGDTTTSDTSKTTTTNTENLASTTMTDETTITNTGATTDTMTSETVHSLSDTITTTIAETTVNAATTVSSTMTPVTEFSTTTTGATTDSFTTTTIHVESVTEMTTTPSSEYPATENETSTIFASESTTTTNLETESMSTTEGEDQRSTSLDSNTETDVSSTTSVTDKDDVVSTLTIITAYALTTSNDQAISTTSSITESLNEGTLESNTDSQVGQATSNEFPWWIIVVVIVVVLIFLAVIIILWRFKNKKMLSKKKNSDDHETLTSEEHKGETGHGTYNKGENESSSLTTDTALMNNVKFEDYNDVMDILNTGVLPVFLHQNPPEQSQLNLLSKGTNAVNAKPSFLPARLTPINEQVKHVMTEHAKKKKKKKHNHKDKQKRKETNKNVDDSENVSDEKEKINVTNDNSESISDQSIMKKGMISKFLISEGNIDSNANLLPDINSQRNQLDIERQDSNAGNLSKERQLSLLPHEAYLATGTSNHDDSQQKEQKKHKKKKHRDKSMNREKTNAILTLNPISNRSLRAVPTFDPFLRIVDSAPKSAMVTKLGLPRDLTDVDC